MWIVAIAWMYVAVMMAMAEATAPQGSVLGAIVTFVFYGLLPMAIVMYLLGAPARRKALRAAEAQDSARRQAEQAAAQTTPQSAAHAAAATGEADTGDTPHAAGSTQADAGSLPASDAIAPIRKEP